MLKYSYSIQEQGYSEFCPGEPLPNLWCVVVTGSGCPDGESPVLVPGLVLLLHVTGLIPHTVAVLHPSWRETPGGVRVLAGAASLLVVIQCYTGIG